ncbi:MAG: imidazole glycerol phosphate synthase subunit HisH [Lachnospiraceae bacterium]|nr:imidazole glycerol phosphate synthase subunit HisH [Lachnospiraceae bacterium]
MIAILDYDAGNIRSVEKALLSLGQDVIVTRDAETILKADRVVLPGVGVFGDAMGNLEKYGLVPVIKKVIDNNTPFMAICVGIQLLFEESEESPGAKGLGIFRGKILRIPPSEDIKVPQIGWNSLHIEKPSVLLNGIKENAYVYFVHSFYVRSEEEDIVTSSTEYGVHIHASVERGNVFATQFHPEKSSSVGLKILKNFVEYKG